MRIALSVPHARWWPHRSGYQYRHPSYTPDEYDFGRRAWLDVAPQLVARGHTVRTFEKETPGQDCGGRCAPNPKQCGRYNAAIVNSAHEADKWRPDLAIELHANNGTPGRHGAFALCNESDLAASWALAFLGAWVSSTPLEVFADGVWQYLRPYSTCDASQRWGRKWFLEHAGPATVQVECGFASSAVDSAYLATDSAVQAAVGAAIAATDTVEE